MMDLVPLVIFLPQRLACRSGKLCMQAHHITDENLMFNLFVLLVVVVVVVVVVFVFVFCLLFVT